MKEATKQLKNLKASAARYVVAGTIVAVWWDAVDARTAYSEKDQALATAYTARSIAGAGTIFTTAFELFVSEKAVVWLSRINVFLGIATVAATYAIGKLNGDVWINWLLAQPFRVPRVKDADKNAFIGQIEDAIDAARPIAKEILEHLGRAASEMGGVPTFSAVPTAPQYPSGVPASQILKINTKTPFKSEAEMMSKLADAISEMK